MIRLRYREISQGRWVQCQPRELQMFCLFRAPKKRDQFLIGGRYLSEHGGDSNASEVLSFAPWVPLCFFFWTFFWGTTRGFKQSDLNLILKRWVGHVYSLPKGRFTIPKRSRLRRIARKLFFWIRFCLVSGVCFTRNPGSPCRNIPPIISRCRRWWKTSTP